MMHLLFMIGSFEYSSMIQEEDDHWVLAFTLHYM
jgi:hypothetical protein